MKKTKRSFLLGACICVFLFSLGIGTGSAQDARLVKIVPNEDGKGFYMDPPTIYIKTDTIVVWLNGVRNKLKIEFREGSVCKDVTASPKMSRPGFHLDAKNCFVTSYIPFAETSTLQFPERGTFRYTVVPEEGTFEARGTIIVNPESSDQD